MPSCHWWEGHESRAEGIAIHIVIIGGTSTDTATSSSVVALSSIATGASFIERTVMVAVAGAQAADGSQASYVKLSAP
jgi:hypothetical protein